MGTEFTPTHGIAHPDGLYAVDVETMLDAMALTTDAALTAVGAAGFKVEILTTAPNLDTLTAPGVRGIYGSPASRPAGAGESGAVITYPINGTAITQEWVNYGIVPGRWERFYTGSTWSAWTRIDGANKLTDSGFLGVDGDLDTATTPGAYGYWGTDANAPGDNSGTVWAARVNSDNNVVQLAIEYGTAPGIYTRFRGSVWSGWTRMDIGDAPVSVSTGSTPTALKTLPVALSASTLSTTETVAAGAVRFPFKVNAPITRWRLHIRNYNDRSGTPYPAVAWFNGLWVGAHAGGGAFTSTPTRILQSFTLPAGGGEYVTPWSNVPLGGDVEQLLSLGWSSSPGPNTSSPAGCYRSTTTEDAYAIGAAGFTNADYVPFSWWVEVETYATTPTVAGWGDSIITGTGNDLILHDSLLSQYCRTIGAIPVHHSFPGTGMVAWTNANTHQWTRWSHLSRADAVIHFMGQNDLGGAETLAAMQGRYNDTIELLKSHVSPNVFLGTLTPHAGKSEALNTVRKNYNTWLKTLPGGARDCFDFSAAVQNAANDAMLPQYTSDTLHLTTLGSTAVAATITRPVTTVEQTAEHELRGTGMPNGTVTADPGTYYTDTAGTNGAWRWLKKSGTGATGWEVVVGDTGWRAIAPTAPLVSDIAARHMVIRRTGSSVALSFRVDNATPGGNRSDIQLLDIPPGFTLANMYQAVGSTYCFWDKEQATLLVSSFTALQIRRPWSGTWAGNESFGGVANWPTNDPWPTALPGAPA